MMLCVTLVVVVFLLVKNSQNSEIASRIFGVGLQVSGTGEGFDNGWKSLYADVFRVPTQFPLFTVIIGIGIQTCAAILLNCLSNQLLTFDSQSLGTFMFFYCICGCVGGVITSFLASSYDFMHIARTIRISCVLQTITAMLVSFLLYLFPLMIQSTLRPDWIDFVLLFCGLTVINTFLSLLTSRLGENLSQFNKFPHKPSNRERKTVKKFPLQQITLIIAFGALPFMSLLHEALTFEVSFRNAPVYYCALLVVSLGLCATTAIMTTFALLNLEYHQWHWSCFLSGGISSFYLFIFSMLRIYFHVYHFSFSTFCIYALKSGIFFSLLFLVQGSTSHLACQWFIRKIYSSIKFD